MDNLLQRARRFDPQALAEIYDTFSPGLYAYACRLLGDECLAEDCVAETFSRFLKALRSGKGPQDYLQAYLYRIAHNWITDQYRRRPPAPVELNEDFPVSEEQYPEKLASRAMLQAEVREALFQLTPDQRQVILLRFYEGWENERIAAALQKQVGAVKGLQFRAVAALKRLLLEEEEMQDETQ